MIPILAMKKTTVMTWEVMKVQGKTGQISRPRQLMMIEIAANLIMMTGKVRNLRNTVGNMLEKTRPEERRKEETNKRRRTEERASTVRVQRSTRVTNTEHQKRKAVRVTRGTRTDQTTRKTRRGTDPTLVLTRATRSRGTRKLIQHGRISLHTLEINSVCC